MTVVPLLTVWPRQDDAADDRPSNAPAILGAVGAMMGLSTACTLLRIYVRGIMIKTFGMDDGVIVLAWVWDSLDLCVLYDLFR